MEWKQTLGDEDADLEVSGSAKLFSKGAQVHTKGVRLHERTHIRCPLTPSIQERRKFIDKVLLQVQGGRGAYP